MKINVRQKFILLSFIVLGGNGFIGYAVYRSNQKMLEATQLVQHTERVIYESGNILSLAKDIETAARGFVITNDSSFIEPLRAAEETSILYIAQLRKLTKDNQFQQQPIDSLDFYLRKRLDHSFKSVELRSKKSLESAIEYVSAKQGKHYTDRIRVITADIQHEEDSLLQQRKQLNESSATDFNRFSVFIFVLMILFTVLLLITIGNYLIQNEEKNKRAAELAIADKELFFQNQEREKREAELVIANKELAFQTEEKGKRAAELVVADIELAFQDEEKSKRAAELVIADKELLFQTEEKSKRAAELVIADVELAFQTGEKIKRAEELIVANKELIFQNKEKEKRAEELVIANTELVFQNKEKEKRAEELIVAYKELHFQNEEKEKLAQELIVANKELIFQNEEKEKRAEELILANKELESFSYSVSHDLRAPLRAVHGYARMLKEDFGAELASEPNRLMDSIMSNAKRMGQLLDDLLTFSRLGRKELVKLNIPMMDIVKNLCQEIKSEACHSHIQFIIRDLESAKGDNVVIKQVWLNLISNAVKYSSLKENPVIEIGSKTEGEEIIYSINDNGVGFDMNYANKLFGLFQRLHTDEQFEGTGVGLAIIHRIISKHDGRVWAESKVNGGATFYFSLPKNVSS